MSLTSQIHQGFYGTSLQASTLDTDFHFSQTPHIFTSGARSTGRKNFARLYLQYVLRQKEAILVNINGSQVNIDSLVNPNERDMSLEILYSAVDTPEELFKFLLMIEEEDALKDVFLYVDTENNPNLNEALGAIINVNLASSTFVMGESTYSQNYDLAPGQTAVLFSDSRHEFSHSHDILEQITINAKTLPHHEKDEPFLGVALFHNGNLGDSVDILKTHVLPRNK